MMQVVRYSANPNLALQKLISSNPQIAQVVSTISQFGTDPEHAFYALASKMGVDPQKVLAALQ